MRILLPFALALPLLVACGGGPQVPPDQLLAELARARETPVSSGEESATHSRLVQDVVDADALQDLRRFEVEEKIGRGEPCSRHPRCGQLGFQADDWFYPIGAMGEGYGGPVPLLIVGFDRHGAVDRVWTLRTH